MKRSARTENTVQEAARVGEELREARNALGVSLEDAAAQLRTTKTVKREPRPFGRRSSPL